MSNFLTHPCLETIQASLIIGNVLSYNMNPGVAYIFLGMTLRMAFSIGLQINSQKFTDAEKWTRRRIWWALAWQDSHFAVSYDRPTSSVLCTPDIPYGRFSTPGDRSYPESMFAIIRLTQEIIRERLLHPRSYMTWETIRRYTEEVASIVADGAIHLRERNQCHRMSHHLERLALKVHSSYITSELCRPALKDSSSSDSVTHIQTSPGGRRKTSHTSIHSPKASAVDAAVVAEFRQLCVRSLERTVSAYVEIHGLNRFAARSWIGIQRSISAAFLLGTLPETCHDPQRLALLRDLEQVIAQRTVEDPNFEGLTHDGSPAQRRLSVTQPPLAESPHWARSMAKSLNALGKLNAALSGPRPGSKYPTTYHHTTNGHTGNIYNLGMATNPSPTHGQPPSSLSQFNPMPPLKQEPFQPGLGTNGAFGVGNVGMGVGSGGIGMGPITPDSTGSSGDWNFGNMHERAAEYVQAPLWGDAGLGGWVDGWVS